MTSTRSGQVTRDGVRRKGALLSGTALTASLLALGGVGVVMTPSEALALCAGVDVIACGDGGGGINEAGVVATDKEITIVPGGNVATGILYTNGGNTASFLVFVQGPSDTQPGATVAGTSHAFNIITTTGDIDVNADADTSISGGTGDGLRLRTTTGDITLNMNGDVSAGSSNSEAIDASSSAGGTVTATINAGTYTGDDNEVVVLSSTGGLVDVRVENGVVLTDADRHGLWVLNSAEANIWFDGIVQNVDDNGIHVGANDMAPAGGSAQDVTIEIGENGHIVGGRNGIYVDASGDVTFRNSGHVEGDAEAGATITALGTIRGNNDSFNSIVGATNGLELSGDVVAFNNSGLTAGLGGHGIVIENVAGSSTVQTELPGEFTWTPVNTSVVLTNTGFWDDDGNEHLGGIILGTDHGVHVRSVTDGDVVIFNAGFLNQGGINDGKVSNGGLIGGVNSGVDVRNVNGGSLFVWNGNTRRVENVNDLSDAAINDDVYSLFGTYLDANDQLPGGYSSGIWSWNDHAVKVRNVYEGVDVWNGGGLIVSVGANAVDVSNVAGNDLGENLAFVYSNGTTDISGGVAGLTWGGGNGVDLWNISGGAGIFNNEGTTFGVQTGVEIRNVVGNVDVESFPDGLIQGLYGHGIYLRDVTDGEARVWNEGRVFAGDSAVYIRDSDFARVNNLGIMIGDGDSDQAVIRLRGNSGPGPENDGSAFVWNHQGGLIASRALPHSTESWTAPDPTELPGWAVDTQSIWDDFDSHNDFVNNGGTLDTAALFAYGDAASDWAVRSEDGGATELRNDGVLVGRVRLSGENGDVGNYFENNSVWLTRGWNGLVGSGDDEFVNNGWIQSAFDTNSSEWTGIRADDIYNNGGIIMIDGATGDRTTLFGNYHGGGRIGIDVDLAMGDSDLFRLRDGDTNGTTGVLVRLVDDGGVFGSRIEFANYEDGFTNDLDFGLDSASDNFIEMGGQGFVQDGLLAWYIDHDMANDQFDLVAGWGPGALAAPALITGAQNIFHATLGVVADNSYGGQFAPPGGGGADLVELSADPVSGTRVAAWAKGIGEAVQRTTSVTLAPPGVTVDTSTEQGIYAMLGGVDVTLDETLRFGAFGGAVGSTLDFNLPGVSADYAGGTAGVYGAYNDGALYVDVTGKADLLAVTYNYAGNSVDATATSYGVLGNAGYRFSAGAGFVEPTASVAAVSTQITDMAGINIQDGTSVRAGAGVRVGMDVESGDFKTEIAVLGKVSNEFGGPNTASVTSGGTTLTAVDDIDGLIGEVAGTATVMNLDGNLSGFVKIGGKFGERQTSYDAQAGLRVAF